jgi:hypothetical protein
MRTVACAPALAGVSTHPDSLRRAIRVESSHDTGIKSILNIEHDACACQTTYTCDSLAPTLTMAPPDGATNTTCTRTSHHDEPIRPASGGSTTPAPWGTLIQAIEPGPGE